MALIATRTLYLGGVIAAQPGNVVSPDAVEAYGWQDGVQEVRQELPEPEANVAEPAEGQTPQEPAKGTGAKKKK